MSAANITDAAAYALLERIAEKAVEPFNLDDDNKTVGAWRSELCAIVTEAVWFVAERRRQAEPTR